MTRSPQTTARPSTGTGGGAGSGTTAAGAAGAPRAPSPSRPRAVGTSGHSRTTPDPASNPASRTWSAGFPVMQMMMGGSPGPSTATAHSFAMGWSRKWHVMLPQLHEVDIAGEPVGLARPGYGGWPHGLAGPESARLQHDPHREDHRHGGRHGAPRPRRLRQHRHPRLRTP